MRRPQLFKNKLLFVALIVDFVLLLSVLFLMDHVRYLLNLDARINLTEIVTQNKNVITSRLTLESNNVEMLAQQLSDRLPKQAHVTDRHLRTAFLAFAQEREDARMFLADGSGVASFSDGQRLDIAGRRYYQLAMAGTQNISDRTVSRLDGRDIFVISVPLYHGAEVVGAVQRYYTPQEMYQLCAVPLFSEQGATHIINGQGYVLLGPQGEATDETENFFRSLYTTDPAASKQLAADIKSGTAGFMESNGESGHIFAAYTPLDQIYDWYLITSVATAAVSPNGNIVIDLFYVILLVVVLFFACLIFYFLYTKNRQRSELEELAFVDTVTGGSTYTKFTVDLKRALAAQPHQPAFIFTFDIDNFKYINSSYGFETGDRILRHIYKIYQQELRPGELLARVTGDQFVALLWDASPQRLQLLFTSEMRDDDVGIYLSGGLYPIGDIHESPNLMLDKASIAAQKTKGKHFKTVALYSEEFDRQVAQNEKLKRALEDALVNDEIVPFFQPKVDIHTRQLVGAEALARWRTRDGKLVAPCEFVPVCEQTGLIVSVDLIIFEKTLQFLQKNLANSICCVPISVNFSRLHLYNQNFLDMLVQKLAQYNVPPEYIEIELTETIIFDNFQTMGELVRSLHQAGIRVSMDDFGSGYSSLHMLKDIDIDVLKIDRGFLLGTANSSRQAIIFGSIVRMAQDLGIHVVVEGVETAENLQLMQNAGCATAQGFYFSKPLPEEQFQAHYQSGSL